MTQPISVQPRNALITTTDHFDGGFDRPERVHDDVRDWHHVTTNVAVPTNLYVADVASLATNPPNARCINTTTRPGVVQNSRAWLLFGPRLTVTDWPGRPCRPSDVDFHEQPYCRSVWKRTKYL